MPHSLEDLNRRKVTLRTSKVGEVVPEYFEEDNSKFITFLEKYHDHLDSNQTHGFGHIINELIYARDIAQTSTANLDELIKEIGNGLQSSSFFKQPRLMAKLLGDFYRTKGSLNSAEGFFRGFFNQEAEVSYPKEKIFIVGESQTGFESQRFIQDNAQFQIFSILIRCGISVADYVNLYKKFVHPAGFHFAGEVLTATEVTLGPDALGAVAEGIAKIDSADPSIKLVQSATLVLATPFSDITGIQDSSTGIGIRTRLDQVISDFTSDSSTAATWNNFYTSIKELIQTNSFTFDDSANPGPDTSMTYETMDNEIFTSYTSDSAS
tara:strand:- start:224 stop:1192 length:969 start_codon:yes stop_codon:yes gene_type:complete